jgi:hypothetical protein
MRTGGVQHEWNDEVMFCGNFSCQSCQGKQVHKGVETR